MKLICLPVTMIHENVYFYYDEETNVGVVIDPGGEPDRLCRFITDNELKIEGILLTHGHYDHILAVDAVKRLTSAPVACHADEDSMLRSDERNFSGRIRKNTSIEAEILFQEDDVFSFGGHGLTVIHTPGHTPGGACYYDAENATLFSGDTLFFDSVGRTDFPGGSDTALLTSIREKLFRLPDSTAVYPGHGEATTIGHEKAHNPFVKLPKNTFS